MILITTHMADVETLPHIIVKQLKHNLVLANVDMSIEDLDAELIAYYTESGCMGTKRYRARFINSDNLEPYHVYTNVEEALMVDLRKIYRKFPNGLISKALDIKLGVN